MDATRGLTFNQLQITPPRNLLKDDDDDTNKEGLTKR